MEFPGSPRARAVSGDLPAAEELGSHLEPAVAGTRPGLVKVNCADPVISESARKTKVWPQPNFDDPPSRGQALAPVFCTRRERQARLPRKGQWRIAGG